jgi:hypothetical protein
MYRAPPSELTIAIDGTHCCPAYLSIVNEIHFPSGDHAVPVPVEVVVTVFQSEPSGFIV